jgi:hypothetical protein
MDTLDEQLRSVENNLQQDDSKNHSLMWNVENVCCLFTVGLRR